MGGLGNQCFIIATMLQISKDQAIPYYISKETKSTPASLYIPERGTYWDTVFHKLKFNNYSPEVQYLIKEQDSNLLVNIPPITCHAMISGYFQSHSYFTKQIVDEYIKLPEAEEKKVDALWDSILELKNKNDLQEVVSIHIRRGDYLNLTNFHIILSQEWYKEALSHFNSECLYVIYSDDKTWAKEWASNNLKHFYVADDVDYIELFLMSRSDSCILSPSSFSWFGAVLGAKKNKVICPDIWFRDYFKQKYMRNLSDWIEIKV
jgi:hypothetical protein